MRYRVVIEWAGENYSAYVPDLPGCIATAPTREAVATAITDAIRFHIAGMRADGQPVPIPTIDTEDSRDASHCDPFATFTEWAGEADRVDYADL